MNSREVMSADQVVAAMDAVEKATFQRCEEAIAAYIAEKAKRNHSRIAGAKVTAGTDIQRIIQQLRKGGAT